MFISSLVNDIVKVSMSAKQNKAFLFNYFLLKEDVLPIS